VYVHVSAEGTLDGGCSAARVPPTGRSSFAGGPQTAIAWTTSASVVAVIEMVRDGTLPQRGFLKQEEIPLSKFLATTTGRLFE
jgi:saccharopine dehydrogenase (NAD+, L-lysine-forming)